MKMPFFIVGSVKERIFTVSAKKLARTKNLRGFSVSWAGLEAEIFFGVFFAYIVIRHLVFRGKL
jgi:hypothetical protein